MSRIQPNPLLPVHEPADSVENELLALLDESFAQTSQQPGLPPFAQDMRAKLMRRLAASREAQALKITARHGRSARASLAPGASAQVLYEAPTGRALRPGEPLRVRIIRLEPGTTLSLGALQGESPLVQRQREWLVLDGGVRLARQDLSRRYYHALPAGLPTPELHATESALVLLRESDPPAQAGGDAITVLDAQAGWPDYAPGIQRRVLWQRDGQAAFLYYAQPGAQVPAHAHTHDEECLMLQGELFLDDLLLRQFDYQLAPAGTGHQVTETDTGGVLFAHGDIDLHFIG